MRWFLLETHQQETLVNRGTLIITVVGLLVLLAAVLFSLYTSYLRTQVYLAQVNPIVALPNIDLTQLTTSVAAIEASLMNMADYYEPSEFDRISSSLYPNDFLASLPATEAARRAVIDTPSLSTIHTYRDALNTTLTEYQKALQTYQHQFESGSNLTTYFLDGKTSTAHLVTTIQLLKSNIAELITLNSERVKCFSIDLQPHCLYQSSMPPRNIDNSSTTTQPSLEVLQFINDEWSDNEPFKTTVVSNTVCGQGSSTVTYAWKHDTSRIHNVSSLKATIIDNLYFYELNNLPETPYYRNLLAQGYLYDFQPTNPYMCLGFAHDIATLALTDYLTQELTHTPLFAGSNNPNLSELAHLEQVIVATGGRATAPILAYIAALHSLLDEYDKTTLQNLVGAAAYRRAHDYHLIAQTNSMALLPTLGLIDDMMHTSLYILQNNKINLNFLFLARSYFTASLLFNNSTLVLNPVQLYIDDSQTELKNFNLTPYASIKEQYSLSEIRAVMPQ